MSRIEISVDEKLEKCRECGYALGFHISVERDNDNLRLILHCPHCGTEYDPGLLLQAAPLESGGK